MTRQQATARYYAEIWPHAATVQRAAQMLMRRQADADDVAQETMIKAFRAMDRFSPGTDARAWLLTILRNTRIDFLRSAQGKTAVSLSEVAVDPAAAPIESDPAWHAPQDLMEALSDQQVIEAMRRLPDEIRWTLLLVDVEGLDHAEAAGVLGVPVGTVKSRAHRGRAMLRNLLAPLTDPMRLSR